VSPTISRILREMRSISASPSIFNQEVTPHLPCRYRRSVLPKPVHPACDR
jgi:hypothetical protein